MIDVHVKRDEGGVILAFEFEKTIELNLSTDDQQEVALFFEKMLAKLFDDYIASQKEYRLKLVDDNGTDLFHDVAQKYVANLDTEIQSIYSKFNQ